MAESKFYLRIPVFLSIFTIVLSACGSFSSIGNQSTREAQIERANRLATQIDHSMEITLQAQNAQATATHQALDQMRRTVVDWPLIIEAGFDSDQGSWLIGEQSNEYGVSTWSIEAGKYRWEVQANQGLVWWSVPDLDPVSDFYLSVSAEQVEGSPAAVLGLVFRKQEDGSYYTFQVHPLGEYSIYLYQEGGWQEIVSWKNSTAIKPGAINHLEIISRDDSFFFYVNEILVDELFDNRLGQGTAGLIVGLGTPAESGVWEFDDFILRLPPGENALKSPTP